MGLVLSVRDSGAAGSVAAEKLPHGREQTASYLRVRPVQKVVVLHHNCGSSRIAGLEKGRTWPLSFPAESKEDFWGASSGICLALNGILPLCAVIKGRDLRIHV